MTKIFYLASPYSHPERAIQEQREQLITMIGAELTVRGINVFTPITASAQLVKVRPELGGAFNQWGEIDLEMIRRSDGLIIASMDGLSTSKGARAETLLAISLNLPIRLAMPPRTDIPLGAMALLPEEMRVVELTHSEAAQLFSPAITNEEVESARGRRPGESKL
jgi:hypothetical protein